MFGCFWSVFKQNLFSLVVHVQVHFGILWILSYSLFWTVYSPSQCCLPKLGKVYIKILIQCEGKRSLTRFVLVRFDVDNIAFLPR